MENKIRFYSDSAVPKSKYLQRLSFDFLEICSWFLSGNLNTKNFSRTLREIPSQEKEQLLSILFQIQKQYNAPRKIERMIETKSFSETGARNVVDQILKFQHGDKSSKFIGVSEAAKLPSSEPSEAGFTPSGDGFNLLPFWLNITNR